jgi:hypothetical protein
LNVTSTEQEKDEKAISSDNNSVAAYCM